MVISYEVNPKLEKEFRDEVFRRFGMKRGNLTNSIHEAIRLWIDTKPKGT